MSVRIQSAIAVAMCTAQDRRRLHRDLPLVRQHDRLQPHQILAAAAAGALDIGDAGGDRDRLGQRQPAGRGRRRCRHFGGLVGLGGRLPGCRRFGLRLGDSAPGASAGRGLGNGTAARAIVAASARLRRPQPEQVAHGSGADLRAAVSWIGPHAEHRERSDGNHCRSHGGQGSHKAISGLLSPR